MPGLERLPEDIPDAASLSLRGRDWPSAFVLRRVEIPPGSERAFDAVEWHDTFVVIESGAIELEDRDGERRVFVAGDMLCPGAMTLRVIRNTGREPALISAISRRPSVGSTARWTYLDDDR
jgi:mannose-6-phosphate isomerase-like protein (cupin superfamily)